MVFLLEDQHDAREIGHAPLRHADSIDCHRVWLAPQRKKDVSLDFYWALIHRRLCSLCTGGFLGWASNCVDIFDTATFL